MPRILFVAAHRPQRSPSQRFRFEQYLEYLSTVGYTYDYCLGEYGIYRKDDKIFASLQGEVEINKKTKHM